MHALFTNRKLLLLTIILIVSNLIITGVSLIVIYNKSIQSLESNLLDVVERQKSLVTVLHEQGKSDEEVIALIKLMRGKYYGIGHRGDFAIGRVAGENIHFLLATNEDITIKRNKTEKNGLPMQLALQGKTGVIFANDYKGLPVLAAYGYVPALQWGIVAKMPSSEVTRPYYYALFTALFVSILVITLCVLLFIKISNPIIKDIIGSEEKFKNLVKDISVGILLQGAKAEILLSNLKALEMLGITEDQLLGKTSFDPDWNVIHEDGSPFPGDTHPVPQAIATSVPVQNVIMGVYHPVKGDRVWLLVDAIPQLHDDGTVKHVICSFIDITERKQAEKQVIESEKRYALTLDAVNDGFWDWDIPTGNAFFSPHYYSLLGYENEEFKASYASWQRLVHPDDLPQVEENLNTSIENGKGFALELRMTLKSGEWKWFSIRGKVVERDVNQKALRMVGTLGDITERKQHEFSLKENTEEIQTQNEEYQQINNELLVVKDYLEQSDRLKGELLAKYNETQKIAKTGNWEWNLMTNEVWWSEGTYHIFEVNPNEFIPDYNANSIFILPEELDAYYKIFKRCIETGHVLNHDFRIQIPSGKIKHCNIQGIVIHDNNNVPFRFIGTIVDITFRKEIENTLQLKNEELQKAKEKAEESDVLKTAFLQNMSHEIRTPMNAIMGFSDLLADQYNNKSKLEYYAGIINQRSADLLELINEILDIAKIESGQLPVHFEECDLNSLFDDLSTFFTENKKRADKKHIKLNIQLHEPCLSAIITDKVKLKQIFINLIGNAFKFTEKGNIQAGCKFDDKNNLVFYVSDTGIGIPVDKQNFVFERFAQLETDKEQTTKGTGLGLSIVKGLVTLLGGNIWIESEPGKGTTFYFTLSYELDNTEKEKKPIITGHITDFNFADRTILIVEDDHFNAAYLKEILCTTGAMLMHTRYGREAVNMALAASPDMILMDINLPDIDGYEAIRQIKLHKPALKIIAQTAYAASEDRLKAMGAGCIDYISKPLKKNLLLTMIGKHMRPLGNEVIR